MALRIPTVGIGATLSAQRLNLFPALSQEAVEEAVNLIITKFMPLKPEDTEGWANDPEEWLTSEDKENEQWEYEIRVSSMTCNAFPFSILL